MQALLRKAGYRRIRGVFYGPIVFSLHDVSIPFPLRRPVHAAKTLPSPRHRGTIGGMAVIHDKDVLEGKESLARWNDAAREALAQCGGAQAPASARMGVSPRLPRRTMAMAVRYSLYALEKIAPGPGVEVRVAPYAAVKVLEGPASDPHNLTPPDVIELEPAVWLRMVCGITTWAEEKEAGHIAAVGERDDLSRFLPLVD